MAQPMQARGAPPPRGPITGQRYGGPQAAAGPPYGGTPPRGPAARGGARRVSQGQAGSNQRIDPEAMPRPKYNKEVKQVGTRSVVNTAATSFPGVLEPFVAMDDGSANPRFLRMTMNQVPHAHARLKDSGVPFGVVMQPFARILEQETPVVVVDKTAGLERCGRCKGYKCAFTKCDPSTGWWKCHLCGHANGHGNQSDVNKGRYDADVYGTTGDPDMRQGSFEYIVSGPYAPRILEPIFVFVVDLTIHALATGGSTQVLLAVRKALVSLAKQNPAAKVGIVTFDSAIDFHDLSDCGNEGSSGERKSKLVTDVDDPFCPMPPSQWLVKLADRMDSVNALIDTLINYAQGYVAKDQTSDSPGIQSIGSAALYAVADGLATTGGKVSYFTAALSSRGAFSLTNRENARKYGAEKEHEMFEKLREDNVYSKWARKLAETLVSIDVYSLSSSYLDLGSLSMLCNETGGSINRFPGFEIGDEVSHAQLAQTLAKNVTSVRAIDTVMKLRISSGFRLSGYIGPGHVPLGAMEQYLACIHEDTTVAAQLAHDGSDTSKIKYAYVQLAILYTNMNGERRLRVHNAAVEVSKNLNDVFRFVDVDAVTSFLSKRAAQQLSRKTIPSVRKSLNVSVVAMLTAYRKYCAKNPSNQQLILPEALKLLPVYTLGMLKETLLRVNPSKSADVIRGNVLAPKIVRADERVSAINNALRMPVAEWLRLIYPLMTLVTPGGASFPHSSSPVPALLPPSMARVPPSGVVFITTGRESILYICDGAPPKLLEELTGSQVLAQKTLLTTEERADVTDGKMQVLHNVKLLSNFRESAGALEAVRVVTFNSPLNTLFLRMLVEDKQTDLHQMDSYEDFLCKIHGSIKAELQK